MTPLAASRQARLRRENDRLTVELDRARQTDRSAGGLHPDHRGRPPASHYRRHRKTPAAPRPPVEPGPQPRALTAVEKAEVLELLHEERFVDLSPGEVWAILLDEGRYLCSESTMYRLLCHVHGQVQERRRHAVHPPRSPTPCAHPT